MGAAAEVPVEILYHFLERADLMKELKPMRKEDTVQELTHAGCTLSPNRLIVFRIQRGGVRHGTIMFGMVMQRLESAGKRSRQPFAELRSHADGAQGFVAESCELEFNGFVQRNAEHVVE